MKTRQVLAQDCIIGQEDLLVFELLLHNLQHALLSP